jgi:flavin-binding protein dodecin
MSREAESKPGQRRTYVRSQSNRAGAVSETGFKDAISQGVRRATSTLRNVEGAWIKDMNVLIEDGNVTGYKVNMEVTFVLEDS